MRTRSTTTSSVVRDLQRRAIDLVERDRLAVDQQAAEAAAPQRLERLGDRIDTQVLRRASSVVRLVLVAVSSLVADVGTGFDAGIGDDRQLEADQQPRARRQLAEPLGHDFGRLADHLLAALAAERPADAREQQPHVVVDLGRRADRRARIADAVLLADGDGRADALDAIDVGLLHPLEELPGVGRQRLDVAPLPFGVDRVEGERRLSRSADAGDDDQLAGGQRDVDVLEVVRARAAHDERASGLRRLELASVHPHCGEFPRNRKRGIVLPCTDLRKGLRRDAATARRGSSRASATAFCVADNQQHEHQAGRSPRRRRHRTAAFVRARRD